ncbi:MAG: hypothetical protein MMC33_009123, partial [Icmadophila ericetorum]|nr:hypothetical protein [Icmadophila ericetorum]
KTPSNASDNKKKKKKKKKAKNKCKNNRGKQVKEGDSETPSEASTAFTSFVSVFAKAIQDVDDEQPPEPPETTPFGSATPEPTHNLRPPGPPARPLEPEPASEPAQSESSITEDINNEKCADIEEYRHANKEHRHASEQ